MNKVILGLVAAGVATVTGFFMLSPDAVDAIKNGPDGEVTVINPEPPEIVKEGYSGTSSKVIGKQGSFTGGNDKMIIVSPEPQKIVKEGYSKPYEASASHNAIPDPTPGQVPHAKPHAKPMLVPDKMIEPKPSEQAIPTVNVKKAIQIIEKEVETVDIKLKALEKEIK